MRLPWPFRRSAPDGGATAPAAHGTVQRAVAPVRHEWARTGHLRPSFVGDPGIRVQRFPEEIAGSHLPSPILAPLGHARTSDGPAGLVTGLARPTLAPVVEGAHRRADLPLRHRRTAMASIQRDLTDETTSDDAATPAAAPSARSDPGTPAARSASATPPGPDEAGAGGLPIIEPRRVAPVAGTSAAATIRPHSLTVARTPELTLAPGRAVVAAHPGAGPVVPQVGQSATTPGFALPVTTAGTPMRTILRTSSGARMRLGPPIERSALEGEAPRLELTRPPGRDRPPDPSATPIQRHASLDDAHDHPPGAHPRTQAPLVGGLTTTLADEPSGIPAGREELAHGIPGGLVLARAIAATPDPDDHGGGPRSSWRSGDMPDMGPLAGGVPFAPAAGLRPTVPSPSGSPGHAEAHRLGTPVRSSTTRQAHRDTAQRVAAAGPTGRAHRTSGTSSAVVTRTGSGRPSPSAPTLQRVARPATLAPEMGAVRPAPAPSTTPDLVLARSTPAVAPAHDRPATDATAPGASTSRRVVLRDATDPDTPEHDPGRVAPDTPEAATRSTASASVTSSSTPGGAAGGSIPDRELDEMVRRLYPRLRRSLSSELLVARERAGTLADLR